MSLAVHVTRPSRDLGTLSDLRPRQNIELDCIPIDIVILAGEYRKHSAAFLKASIRRCQVSSGCGIQRSPYELLLVP